MKKTVEMVDKSALTFRQLEAFVKHCKTNGACGDEFIDARVSMGGRLRSIKLKLELATWSELDK